MNRPSHALAICCLLMGASRIGFSQQYPFLPVSGSPKNVKILFQDSRGRLWIGGDQVACFDGTRFFSLRDFGFPSVESYDISEDSTGAIWIGAETGVYRFSNSRVEEVSKGVAVSVIAVTPDIAVAAVGPFGQGIPIKASLVRMQRTGGVWKTETVMSLDSPGPLSLDHEGQILYPWPGQGWSEVRLADLAYWRHGALLPVAHHAAPGPGAGPMSVLRDRSGCVWMGGESENIYDCGDNTWRVAPYEGASVRSGIHEGPDGSMVLVGYSILAVGRPGSFRIAKPPNGLPQLFTAMEARDGTLWLGGAQGLYRFASPFRMEYWTPREGVDSPWAVQRSGADIYAGLNRDVAVLSKDRQHWQSVASFSKFGQVMNLLTAGDGNLLVALNPGGTAMLRRDGTVLAHTAAPFSGDYGLRLAKTPEQEIWLGGISLGRLKREGSRLDFENHRLDNQPAGNVLDVQYEDHTRKLWACYSGGLAVRSEDGSWREISVKEGLLVNPCWSLAALANGDVWYGYYNTPAFALVRPSPDGGFTVRQFHAGDEIVDPESITLDVDQRGWLWRGGNRGLSVADPANAEAGKWLHFDPSDGLSGEGVNSGSYFADSDGSIWVGVDLSIFHYLPAPDLLTPRFAPQVFVSAFSWDNQAPKIAESVERVPHGSKIVAHIGSLQFDRRSAIRLRYRLLPDRSWHETKDLDLSLGTLPPGSHSLEVQGRVFSGPWSPTISRSFTVLSPIWLA